MGHQQAQKTQPTLNRSGPSSSSFLNASTPKPPVVCFSFLMADEPVDGVERKGPKRGFAKIDVVDVILSDEAYNAKNKSNIFEQITESALKQKGSSPDVKGLAYEPTYRQGPKKKFDADVVRGILEEILEKELRDLSYSEKECINACKRITYHIRKAVKQLNYDRYRIICQVRITEKLNQGMETRIGFLWDTNCDSFATYYMETHSLATYAVVYGVYKE